MKSGFCARHYHSSLLDMDQSFCTKRPVVGMGEQLGLSVLWQPTVSSKSLSWHLQSGAPAPLKLRPLNYNCLYASSLLSSFDLLVNSIYSLNPSKFDPLSSLTVLVLLSPHGLRLELCRYWLSGKIRWLLSTPEGKCQAERLIYYLLLVWGKFMIQLAIYSLIPMTIHSLFHHSPFLGSYPSSGHHQMDYCFSPWILEVSLLSKIKSLPWFSSYHLDFALHLHSSKYWSALATFLSSFPVSLKPPVVWHPSLLRYRKWSHRGHPMAWFTWFQWICFVDSSTAI